MARAIVKTYYGSDVPLFAGYHFTGSTAFNVDNASYADYNSLAAGSGSFTTVVSRQITGASQMSGSNWLPGIVVTVPKAGVYEVTALGHFSTDGGSSRKSWRLVEAAGPTIIAEFAHVDPTTADSTQGNCLHGLFNAAAAGTYTFKIQARSSGVSDGNERIGGFTSISTMTISWIVKFIGD